ncbi:MAG: hypothetical protein ACP5SH_27020 [Syntrophobacteraceae bacterium]
MRKSNWFLLYLTGNVVLLLFLFAHAFYQEIHAGPILSANSELVARLDLSDLCLFTDASYTRHLTQTDLDTPFQDCPFCLEHFPSGSLLMPPEMLKRSYGKID